MTTVSTMQCLVRPRDMLVYKMSLEAVSACEVAAAIVVTRRPDLADQLRRAVSSVALNIAEGAAEFSPKEKIRFYRMARRSAVECEAVFDVIERTITPVPALAEPRRSIDDVLALLTNTMKAVEARA